MSSCTQPAANLEALLAAAARTRFYRPWFTGRRRPAESWLRDAPTVTLRDVYRDREAFRNPLVAPHPAEFRYPLQSAPRCLVLTSGFRAGAQVTVVANWSELELRSIASTKAIAAPVGVWRQLAQRPCELLYPITAFTGPCHGVLSETDRDLLWEAFGVPVYEQFLGIGNELLAQDCDVHEGLHIRDDCARFESRGSELTLTSLANLAYPVLRLAMGLRARIEPEVCACGRSGLKLYDFAELPRRLAAIA
jgi:hypothetical protein